MQFCTYKTLASCRRVSKLWQSSSLNAWRKIACASVYGEKQMLDFLSFVARNDSTKQLINFHMGCNNDVIGFQKVFWKVLGAQIKYLLLTDCVLPLEKDFRKIVCKYCPNLEQLHMRRVLYPNFDFLEVITSGVPYKTTLEGELLVPQYGEHKMLRCITTDVPFDEPRGWTCVQFLTHFPHLETLKLTRSDEGNYVDGIFFAVNRIREVDPNKLKLKHICTVPYTGIGDDLLRLLLDPNLQLETLSLTVSSPENGLRLQRILSLQGAYLKTLELFTTHSSTLISLHNYFPSLVSNQGNGNLENLQELTIHVRWFTAVKVLKFTPNLKKLSINLSGSTSATTLEDVIWSDMHAVKLIRCKELTLDNYVSAQELKLLIHWIPNVQKLRIPLNRETLDLVCKCWGIADFSASNVQSE